MTNPESTHILSRRQTILAEIDTYKPIVPLVLLMRGSLFWNHIHETFQARADADCFFPHTDARLSDITQKHELTLNDIILFQFPISHGSAMRFLGLLNSRSRLMRKVQDLNVEIVKIYSELTKMEGEQT